MRGSGGELSLLDKFVKVRLLYIVNHPLRYGSALLLTRGTHVDRREGRNVERESRPVFLLKLAPVESLRLSCR